MFYTVVACRYTKEKFGWDKKRCDQELLPVIQKMNQRKEVCDDMDVCVILESLLVKHVYRVTHAHAQ